MSGHSRTLRFSADGTSVVKHYPSFGHEFKYGGAFNNSLSVDKLYHEFYTCGLDLENFKLRYGGPPLRLPHSAAHHCHILVLPVVFETDFQLHRVDDRFTVVRQMLLLMSRQVGLACLGVGMKFATVIAPPARVLLVPHCHPVRQIPAPTSAALHWQPRQARFCRHLEQSLAQEVMACQTWQGSPPPKP